MIFFMLKFNYFSTFLSPVFWLFEGQCVSGTLHLLCESDIQFGNAKLSCLSATASFLYIFNDHCQLFKVQVIIASHASWYL